MTNLEDLMDKEKNKLDELEIPVEMESKLRVALDNIPAKKQKYKG